MRPKSSSLASRGMLPMTPRSPSPLPNIEMETLCFGGVFMLRGQDKCAASKGRWTGHLPSGHWKWVVDGNFSMRMTQNPQPRQQNSGPRRSTLRPWSGLASIQTLILLDICGGSWRFELPNISLKTLMTWRGSVKRSGTKSPFPLPNPIASLTNAAAAPPQRRRGQHREER